MRAADTPLKRAILCSSIVTQQILSDFFSEQPSSIFNRSHNSVLLFGAQVYQAHW